MSRMGELEPSIAAGEAPPTPPPPLANSPCVVFYESRPGRVLTSAPALWAGAVAGMIGVYQVSLEIPASLSPGSYLLSLTDRRTGNVVERECRLGYQGDELDAFTIEVR